jgi:formate dehydrogenase
VLPFVLYETLGPTLPDGLAGAAALWGLAQKTAFTFPEAVRRAGHADGNALFDAILRNRSGVTFTVHEYEDDFDLITHPDHKIALDMPEMLDEIHALRDSRSGLTTSEFPIVLSAGERRAYTANDIFRDPSWRKRDADGALRVSLEDAEALGLAEGGRARITTAAGSAEASVEITEAMLPGHASLPNADPRCGPERADIHPLAGRIRGNAVAQARSGPDRSRSGARDRQRLGVLRQEGSQ